MQFGVLHRAIGRGGGALLGCKRRSGFAERSAKRLLREALEEETVFRTHLGLIVS